MRRSENNRRSIDWRGWIILAWVVWFGLLYGKMVVEQRGGKLKEISRFSRTITQKERDRSGEKPIASISEGRLEVKRERRERR